MKKPNVVKAWTLPAWLVAKGDTPLRVILASDTEVVAYEMMRSTDDQQIYAVVVRPLPAKRRKARRKA